MTPKLTVHNVHISTATVEIKKFTVDSKQVTLAVFRQLIEEPLVADDGTLNGVPWGTVNYHPGKQCRAVPHEGEQRDYDYTGYEHLHVVWQKGSELRRTTVRTDITWERHHGPALDLFYSTCVAAWLCDMLDDRWFGGREDGAAGSVSGPLSFMQRTMSLCAQALRPGGIVIIFGDYKRLPNLMYAATTLGLRLSGAWRG